MEEVVRYTVMEEVEVVVGCTGIEVAAEMMVRLCWAPAVPAPVLDPALGYCTC
jgi:hypothetical protein